MLSTDVGKCRWSAADWRNLGPPGNPQTVQSVVENYTAVTLPLVVDAAASH